MRSQTKTNTQTPIKLTLTPNVEITITTTTFIVGTTISAIKWLDESQPIELHHERLYMNWHPRNTCLLQEWPGTCVGEDEITSKDLLQLETEDYVRRLLQGNPAVDNPETNNKRKDTNPNSQESYPNDGCKTKHFTFDRCLECCQTPLPPPWVYQ